jgi:rhodanese-related sulfurtransferase
MRVLVFLLIAVATYLFVRELGRMLTRPRVPLAEATRRITAGEALLVDVREPGEWASGVAGPAYLAPLSDLRGPRRKWRLVFEDLKGRELLLYCATGARSAWAAKQLRAEGHQATNLGGLRHWTGAGLPVRQPEDPSSLH